MSLGTSLLAAEYRTTPKFRLTSKIAFEKTDISHLGPYWSYRYFHAAYPVTFRGMVYVSY
jgi:hypothetical protein